MLKKLLKFLFPDSKVRPETTAPNPTYGLELLFDNGEIWKSPNESDIKQAILHIEKYPEAWITLSRGVADFITVITHEEGGYSVEYEPGSRSNHQRLDAPPLPAEQVLDILVSYSLFTAI